MISDLMYAKAHPWSNPLSSSVAQAQIWHARRCASWLLSAGAEPRFGLLLHSGPDAFSRWALILDEQGVILDPCQTTFERPLPIPLTQHRGDHFNRRLFVVEGLDSICQGADFDQPDLLQAYFKTLNGQRRQLRQNATWVFFKVTHPNTLKALHRFAPDLMKSLQRRCWMWNAQEVRAIPEPLLNSTWDLPRSAHLIDHLFLKAYFLPPLDALPDSPDTPIPAPPFSELDLGRWIRCGYADLVPFAPPRWQKGIRLWKGEEIERSALNEASRWGSIKVDKIETVDLPSSLASLLLHHRGDRLSKAWKMVVGRCIRPQDQWQFDPLSIPQPSQDQPTLHSAHALTSSDQYSTLVDSSWQTLQMHIAHFLNGEGQTDQLLVSLVHCSALWGSLPNQTLKESDYKGLMGLWIATGYGLLEEIEECLNCLNKVSSSPQLSPETRFVASEQQVELYRLLNLRNEGQQALDHLFELIDDLHSPLFEARAYMAKALFFEVLDPQRGAQDRQKAQQLATIHGINIG